jgi:hypothetical protein
MLTFSQIVDDMIAETTRGDRRPALISALNQTIRELHSSDVSAPVGFADNLVEVELSASTAVGFSYELPSQLYFQKMEAVYYAAKGAYATLRRPSSILQMVSAVGGAEYGYYRSGSRLIFDNYGGLDAPIKLAWFEYLPGLAYFPVGSRPVEFNAATRDWVYAAAYDVSDVKRAEALNLCTNWMCYRYRDTLMEGLRAKHFKGLGDTDRMRPAYSAFEKMRKDLIAAEEYGGSVTYRS